ncbi:signal transduction histidine kinase/sugar lactone lactonase YvrE [Sphingobium sp. B1D3A]|uniref:Signal transduction histidine kinase/sugar lactone lactonase YvrE n=2 Tax=Sphingobium lignivorans TaxID=2735886 RepID=A0ABR6NHW7_9SPHN|nr:signal transduction histidine kinase/sugar lactone lactonase YvrE [Sphingobium lignivorans]
MAGFKHSSWTPEQGAPGNVVGIAQTPDGYLWLASAEGVFRFDGLAFERIANPGDARFANAIPTAIFVDRQGRLWVGFNQSAGPALYRAGRLHPIAMPAPPPSVMRFAQSADGTIWAAWGGQGERLFRLRGDRWQSVDRALGLPPGEIASLVVTADDSLWVTLGESRERGSLARLKPGAARFTLEPDRIGFSMLARAPDGSLWVSDQFGTRSIRDARGAAPGSPRAMPAVPGAAVPSLAFDRRGGVWGSTRGVGLFRGDMQATGAVERIEAGRRLTSNATIDAFADREGSIWVATDAGIDRYRPVPISPLSAIPPDVQDGIKLAANDTSVYVGAAHDLYRMGKDSITRVRRVGERIAALCPAGNRGVWAVHGNRVVRYGSTAAASFSRPADPVAPTVCAEDRSGRLWIDGEDGLWVREDNRWVERYTGMRNVLDLVPDPSRDGVIANTGDGGLLHLTPTHRAAIPARILGIGPISTIWRTGDTVYASGATGVVRIGARGMARIDSAANPWLVGVRGMARGSDDAAWFLVRLGVVRVAGTELERGFARPGAALQHRMYDHIDGYETRGQAISFRGPQVEALSDGRVLLASRAGLLQIDPLQARAARAAPPVVIRTVSTGRRFWRDPPQHLELPPGTRSLRIGFAVNSLAVPTRNTAFYRMDGSDADWTAAGQRREASYTNLDPGRHEFRVIAQDAEGNWNRQGQRLTIDIPPTFLQSWKFKALCAALAALFLWFVYQLRMRVLARRIRSRMLDRMRERERVARDIHDTLLQSIQALMLRFQLAVDGLPSDTKARRELEDAMDRADEVVAEGRDRLRDLRRGSGLEDPEATLREIAGRQLSGTAIATTVRSSGVRRPLDPVAWDELASIAAEVMFNVARHAHAASMIVDLQYRSTGVALSIADDGIGIPADVAREGRRGHYGIPGMRERAARIGGTLRIARRREGGTEVTVAAPAAMVYRKPSDRE